MADTLLTSGDDVSIAECQVSYGSVQFVIWPVWPSLTVGRELYHQMGECVFCILAGLVRAFTVELCIKGTRLDGWSELKARLYFRPFRNISVDFAFKN